ncbi:putative membrane protein, partial [Vibrio parahaemolyticus EKP-021]
MRHGIVCVAA